MDYPIQLTYNGETVMTLRSDEVTNRGKKIALDLTDAFERKFWELSNYHLYSIKSDLKDGKIIDNPSIARSFIHMIDKIIVQRKFMQDNQSFRNALIPE
ncbi:hypothetical protein ABE82_26400 (plasmid) [Paenibacillus peoriae]|uniref:hypothetical protein n=1 Tax=Paenibacillus peoriae TaxID=59893 RepID=UPI00071EC522|nr:hypothetical protein [Paenibacillus peoriae]ALS09948.1 hypothetical protein ABE82_26400 [Paenibacillus peoriae]